MLSRNIKRLLVFLSLVTVGTTNAAPTIGDSNTKLIAQALSPNSDADSPSVGEVRFVSGTGDLALAHIAAEFLKPPTSSINAAALPVQVSSLPGVPGALFMALAGFLCVSLVKDRKLWMAALAGILWIGQAGITALPQKCRVCIAHHLNKRWAVPTIPSLAEQASRLRSDIEGAEYIGLLRYLEGIPVTLRNTQNAKRHTIYDIHNTIKVRQFASMQFSSLINFVTICLAYKAEQYIRFSPAFIFDNLARGPPNNT